MSRTKTDFLEDQQGNLSMRLMSISTLAASIAFGLVSVLHSARNGPNGLYITMAFLIAAFAPRAPQKFAGVRFPQLPAAPEAAVQMVKDKPGTPETCELGIQGFRFAAKLSNSKATLGSTHRGSAVR